MSTRFVVVIIASTLLLIACDTVTEEAIDSDDTETDDTETSDTETTDTETDDSDTDTTDTQTTPTQCASGPLADPIPNCAPTVRPSTGDFGQDCVDRINQFRWDCQCLPPLARWTEAESCTAQQSADDQATGIAHDHFGACGENAQNTCPNWGGDAQIIDSCLQMMWDEGPGEPFADHGHYINMSSTSYSKVACGRANNGGVWSNQNFKP